MVIAESTQQELADLALRKDGYQLGDILDVRDTVQKWMEGRIVQIDTKKGYYINYLGWSDESTRLDSHYTQRLTDPTGAHQTPHPTGRLRSLSLTMHVCVCMCGVCCQE